MTIKDDNIGAMLEDPMDISCCIMATITPFASIFISCRSVFNQTFYTLGSHLSSVAEKDITKITNTLEEMRKYVPYGSPQFISTITKGIMLSQESKSPPSLYSRILIPNNVDIYLICSEEDAKYAELFCQLLISQNQALIIKISFQETNSSRLSCLETSSLVISLLSPSFISSTELVHELNIAWCRQRYSQEFCFLEIILDSPPCTPTYIHILPCFFNCKDKQWVCSSGIQDDTSCLENLATIHNVPHDIVRCFLFAIKCVISWTTKECSIWGLHNKLSNCLHFSNCLEK